MADWSTDIFGCFENLPWCCITFFFRCITSYSVANKIGKQHLAIMSVIFSILVCLSNIISVICAEVSPKMRALEEGDTLGFHEAGNDWAFIGSRGFSIITLALFVMLAVIVSKIRGAIREQYGIEGDEISDCCLSCFCMECVLCQMKNHLEADQRTTNISRV